VPDGTGRYAYTLNNPLRYNDPSGHWFCEDVDADGNCIKYDDDDYINYYKQTIKAKYNWNIQGDDWSVDELSAILQTGHEIEAYADALTGGMGSAWMDKYMSGIEINFSGGRGRAIPGKISLPTWLNASGKYFRYYFAHELAHQWDINTGHIGMFGAVGGPGDHLNDFINEDSNGVIGSWTCRFCDGTGSKHIPSDYLFKTGVMKDPAGNPYGNNSTADYLAESFALNVYYSSSNHVHPSVTLWVRAYIATQASYLP
jgi:hypothetical protein